MPSSAYQNTAFVLDFLTRLAPKSILDVGSGFGRWGFLCRCHLGGGYSLTTIRDQALRIDSVEVFPGNVSPIYNAVYDHTYTDDARRALPLCGKYDVIICGDMIEHLEKDDAWALIYEMRKHAAKAVVIVTPFGDCPQGAVGGNNFEIHRSTWSRRDFTDSHAFVRVFPFDDRISVGVVIQPVSAHARWLVKTMRNPLRLYAARRFPRVLRAMHRFLVRLKLHGDVSHGNDERAELESVFTETYHGNEWGNVETASGPGSTLANTKAIRTALPILLKELGARTMLDIPCGDFNWMKDTALALDLYIGADVVGDLIMANTEKFCQNDNRRTRFIKLDITRDELPKVDLVLCRDGLVHLSLDDALRAVRNIKASGSTHLLATTFPGTGRNVDITSGQWRALNMELDPFRFPPPLKLINEEYAGGGGIHADKSAGLWRLNDISV